MFDAPAEKAGFEDRVRLIAELIAQGKPAFAVPHTQELCKGLDHLRAELARVESLGGEGLMLRRPGSVYEVGRSDSLLKVKTFHDAEATVIGHQAGAGKHKGRLGALLVQLADGTKFSVGTGFSDAERSAPPAVGSVITFRYQELSDGGVPRFPSYVGVRVDAKPSASLPKGPVATAAAPVVPVTPAVAPPTPPASATPSAAAVPAAAPSGFRRFEFVEGKSAKFWEVAVAGSDVTVRYGRLGSDGQTKTKTFPDPASASAHAAKLISEKTSDGYTERTA